MQVSRPDVVLSPEQKALAEAGWKTLIPIGGRPFLAHLLDQLAAGGIEEVCVVVGPEPHPVADYLSKQDGGRLSVQVAVQKEPLGTAHALSSARTFLEGGPAVVVNGDNLYPAAVVDAIRALPGMGMAGFRAQALLAWSGQPQSRVTAYAAIVTDANGRLCGIEEKPSEAQVAALGPDPLISMNCWRVTPAILPVLASLEPSARGEYELPTAILALVEAGEEVRVLPVATAVPDLTSVEDIPRVSAYLDGLR
jgi:glucose-1-phosphate thymidylyltransferase